MPLTFDLDPEQLQQSFKNYDASTREISISFLADIHAFDDSDLSDYQIPFGDLHDAAVCHLLHWPPIQPTSLPFSIFDFNTDSLRILDFSFPELGGY